MFKLLVLLILIFKGYDVKLEKVEYKYFGIMVVNLIVVRWLVEMLYIEYGYIG